MGRGGWWGQAACVGVRGAAQVHGRGVRGVLEGLELVVGNCLVVQGRIGLLQLEIYFGRGGIRKW